MTTLDKEPASLDDDLAAEFDKSEAVEPIVEDPPKTDPVIETAEEILEAIEAPQMWDKKLKDSFNSWGALGEDGQPLIPNGREWQKDFGELYGQQQARTTQIEQEAADSRRQYEQIQGFQNEMAQVTGPHQQMIVESGETPAVFISKALGFTQSAKRDPVGTLLQVVRAGGLEQDLRSRLEGQEYVSPEGQQIADLRREMARDKHEALQRRTYNAQQAQQQYAAEIDRKVQTFAEAKDDSGNPLHPHLEVVQDQMAQFIHGREGQRRSGMNLPSMDLEEAYTMACQLDPNLTQAAKAETTVTDAARKDADAKKATDAARRVTAGKTGSGQAPTKSLDDELGDLYDKSEAA